ncbi:hypothetical protein ACLQ2R_17085 [Streptosporangium sp. DT93]|uniref:hypothetical protein n=1 Tax=Streptosporangium sp. DT93 TaxID=3393428 RepID=UPI003CED2EDE
MAEPSCGRNCGGCRQCDITRGQSLSYRRQQTEATADGLNRIRREAREAREKNRG